MSHPNVQTGPELESVHHHNISQAKLQVKHSDQSLASSHFSQNPTSDTLSLPFIPSAATESQSNNDKEENFSDLERTITPSGPPDGGVHAWLVCLGTFCALTSSFGWLNSVGVFQAYYQHHYLQSYSSSTISWISSVQVFIIFGGGIIFGKLFDDHGPRWLLLTGTFLQVFGLLMTAQSTEFYQFFLAQAVCSSIGASCIYYASAGAISTWFSKKRATAFGLAAVGASIGGVFFPIMVTRLVDRIGFPWTMRAVALIVLVLNIVAILTVKSLLVHTRKSFSPRKYIHQFKDVLFFTLLTVMTIFSLGLWLPINFLITQGQKAGIPVDLSQYLIPVLNAASIFGRFLPGILGDRFGRLNVLFAATILSGILTLALWVPAKNSVSVFVYAGLYGFSLGAYVSLGPSVVAQLSDIKEIGMRIGVLYFCVGIAVLIGNPIGGQLLIAMNGDFLGLQLFAGLTMVVGACIILSARVVIAGVGWKVV